MKTQDKLKLKQLTGYFKATEDYHGVVQSMVLHYHIIDHKTPNRLISLEKKLTELTEDINDAIMELYEEED